MNILSSKILKRIMLAGFSIFVLFELWDSYQWMTNTHEMYTVHPALGAFLGYELAQNGDGSLQRLPIIMGKWVGMCKFFLSGTLIAVVISRSNRAMTFLSAWNLGFLSMMSFAVYPTLDEVASQYPEDFTNGFDGMWWFATVLAIYFLALLVVGLAAELAERNERRAQAS